MACPLKNLNKKEPEDLWLRRRKASADSACCGPRRVISRESQYVNRSTLEGALRLLNQLLIDNFRRLHLVCPECPVKAVLDVDCVLEYPFVASEPRSASVCLVPPLPDSLPELTDVAGGERVRSPHDAAARAALEPIIDLLEGIERDDHLDRGLRVHLCLLMPYVRSKS